MQVTEYPGREYKTYALQIAYTHPELRIRWKWFVDWIFKVHPQIEIRNSDAKAFIAENIIINVFDDSTIAEIENEKPKNENGNDTGIIKGRI